MSARSNRNRWPETWPLLVNSSASASATNRSGQQSTFRHSCARIASAVTSPIAAIFALPNTRVSRCSSASRARVAATPLALVKMIQSASPAWAMASSTSDKSAGGISSMVGASITSAPSSANWADSSLACWRVRVTAMVLPKSGCDSNQFNDWRSWTTRPTMVIAGGCNPASATFWARSASVPVMVCWRGVDPQRIVAAGMSAGMPCSISLAQIRGSALTPI